MVDRSNRKRQGRRLLGMIVVTASCSGSTPTAPTATTATVVGSPAPIELQGFWTTVLTDGSNQMVTLSLTDRTYGIVRGSNSASGTIGVRGNELDFLTSSLCVGLGTYRFVLTGNSLTLNGSDECPGRIEVLHGYTYTRRSTP